jgi:hypothetical protein
LAENHSNYLFFDKEKDRNSIQLYALEAFFKFVTYIVIGDNLEEGAKDIKYLQYVIKTKITKQFISNYFC